MNAAAVRPPTVEAPAARTVSPRTRLIGATFVLAPLLLLVGDAVPAPAGAAIMFYAFAAFMPVVVTLTGILEVAFPRAAAALTVLRALGIAAGVGFAIDGIHAELPGSVELIDDGGTAGVFVANIPGLMFPLALIGLGLALVRAGAHPRFCGPALILAGLLFPISRIGEIVPLAMVDDLLLLLALAPLGLAIRRGDAVIGSRHAAARA